jgi:hypothetical protein
MCLFEADFKGEVAQLNEEAGQPHSRVVPMDNALAMQALCVARILGGWVLQLPVRCQSSFRERQQPSS